MRNSDRLYLLKLALDPDDEQPDFEEYGEFDFYNNDGCDEFVDEILIDEEREFLKKN